MSTHMLAVQLWTAQAITTGADVTSAAVDIGKANAMALHLTALAGTTPDITFTYSLSSSRDGTYTTPAAPVTIGANIAAVDVLDFAPEAAAFIKITATNNNGGTATLSAQLAVQEL